MTLEELIRTIIPARGRKLEWKLKFLAAFNEMIRTIIPARGRKLARHSYSVVKERLIRTIIPVRGRKHVRRFYYIGEGFLIRTIIPVRGRKLVYKLVVFIACNSSIRTIIPVRGRKLADEIDKSKNSQCDKNHNPHKGTETRLFLAGLQSIAAR